MHLRRCMYWSLSNKIHFLDETNELHSWSTSSTSQERCIHKGLGRRRCLIGDVFQTFFFILICLVYRIDFFLIFFGTSFLKCCMNGSFFDRYTVSKLFFAKNFFHVSSNMGKSLGLKSSLAIT